MKNNMLTLICMFQIGQFQVSLSVARPSENQTEDFCVGPAETPGLLYLL